ncbi:MAG: hypothetical protein MI865_00690 [Proteobacteria bacterium]|nr:hypothetical protein [Pseudomonadota bacterium]
MNSTVTRIGVLFFIPPLFYLIYVAGNWGLADINYRPAKNQLGSWIMGKAELEDKDWDSLRADLSKALEFDPSNPDIHEYLAIALEGRYSKLVPGATEAESFRMQALTHYIKSASMRPSWPYAWNNKMLAKFRLQQIDKEFLAALHNAKRLGPWEPGIQRMVIDVGLIIWPELSRSDRSVVMETISHALEKQTLVTLKLVNKHGLLDVICFIHKDNKKVIEYCKQFKKK